MTCPRCKSAMVEQKRVYHGQRKWVCPACGRVRFQAVKRRPAKKPKHGQLDSFQGRSKK